MNAPRMNGALLADERTHSGRACEASFLSSRSLGSFLARTAELRFLLANQSELEEEAASNIFRLRVGVGGRLRSLPGPGLATGLEALETIRRLQTTASSLEVEVDEKLPIPAKPRGPSIVESSVSFSRLVRLLPMKPL